MLGPKVLSSFWNSYFFYFCREERESRGLNLLILRYSYSFRQGVFKRMTDSRTDVRRAPKAQELLPYPVNTLSERAGNQRSKWRALESDGTVTVGPPHV